MKNLLLLLALTTNIIFSQETCESKEETFEDLNSITKCSFDTSKKIDGKATRQISVKISAPKKRYLKKRTIHKKSVVSNINVLNTSGIYSTTNSSEILNSLDIKKENTAINSILALSNKLSKEEIKKAIKFDEVSTIPLFEKCKNASKNESLSCFNKEMVKHIEKNFNYPSEAVIKKLEGNVWIRFIIGQDGSVTNIKTLGPKGAKVLDNEAKRVVSKLPKFIPAKNKGKKVSVKYGFPISFSLDQ